MLNLLQKSLLYVEEKNAWLSHLQSSITEKESDYNSLHSIISDEIITQVEKLKSADVDDVKMEEDGVVIKEEFTNLTDDVQLQSNCGVDVIGLGSKSHQSKNHTKIQDENTGIKNSLALVPRNIAANFEQLCRRFGLLKHGKTASLPPILQMLLNLMLYIETQNDWFLFLRSGITEKQPDYKRLRSMLSKGILDELMKQNVDDVKLNDEIVIKEEYCDVMDDIQPTNEMQLDTQSPKEMENHAEEAKNTNSMLPVIERNNPDETSCVNEDYQHQNNEVMKIVEINSNVAIIKEEQEDVSEEQEDVKEELDDDEEDIDVDIYDDSSSDYVPEKEDVDLDDDVQNETSYNTKSNTDNNPGNKQHSDQQMEVYEPLNNVTDEKSNLSVAVPNPSNSLVIAKGEKTKTRFECTQCKKTFSFRSVLYRHMHTHSGEKPYKCTFCEKSFTRRDNCNLHMRIHTGEKVYKCMHCEKSYIQIASLNWHIRREHTAEKLAICAAEDINKDNMQSESDNRAGGMFMLTSNGSKQPSQSTDGKSFLECSYCKKAFIKLSSLERHMRTHTGTDKQSQCSYCGKLFKSTRNLIIHLRIHTGEKPYNCPYCESTFKDSTNRNRHVRTHTGEKPFKCDYCDKTFSHSGNRKQHMLVHTGEKPYICSYCDKTFRDRTNCKRHMQTHTIGYT